MLSDTVIGYLSYLILSVGFTIWVARTLFKNGRLFLVESFQDEALADSVNHLLVVGFYLINIGFISLALKYGDKPRNLEQIFEFLSTKVGFVLLILGGMHFLNLLVFSRMRRRTQLAKEQPPVAPQRFVAKPLVHSN